MSLRNGCWGTTIRHYRSIDELCNPDFKTWDKLAKKFVSRRPIDKENNQILAKLLSHYQLLLAEHEFDSGKELFAFQEETEAKTPVPKTIKKVKNQTDSNGITLGEWIEQLIQEMKNPTRLKPSANYQVYRTLQNKLKKENHLIHQPVSDLNDDSFVHLIKWLKKYKGRNGNWKIRLGIRAALSFPNARLSGLSIKIIFL